MSRRMIRKCLAVLTDNTIVLAIIDSVRNVTATVGGQFAPRAVVTDFAPTPSIDGATRVPTAPRLSVIGSTTPVRAQRERRCALATCRTWFDGPAI